MPCTWLAQVKWFFYFKVKQSSLRNPQALSINSNWIHSKWIQKFRHNNMYLKYMTWKKNHTCSLIAPYSSVLSVMNKVEFSIYFPQRLQFFFCWFLKFCSCTHLKWPGVEVRLRLKKEIGLKYHSLFIVLSVIWGSVCLWYKWGIFVVL